MSNDKRTVTTDALETLGTIITENEKRDAIHLAVEPVIAGEKLGPGDDIGFCNDGLVYRYAEKLIGIVDPFLKTEIEREQRFWLIIYPRQINSLRHVWTHPDLPDCPEIKASDKTSKEVSEQWLRTFAKEKDVNYYTLIKNAERNDDPEYLTFYDENAYGDIPPEFWDHIEVVTGTKIPQDCRPILMNCSC